MKIKLALLTSLVVSAVLTFVNLGFNTINNILYFFNFELFSLDQTLFNILNQDVSLLLIVSFVLNFIVIYTIIYAIRRYY